VAAENKSEKATPRRKQKAREKGQVGRSRDLAAALTLLAATFVLAWRTQLWTGQWRSLFGRLLNAGSRGEIGLGTPIFSWAAITLAQWLAPVLFLALGVSIFASAMQGGIVFASEALWPKPERLNPAVNLGQIFSFSGVNRLLRSLIPGTAIVFLAYTLLQRDLPEMVHASRMGSRGLLMEMGGLLFDIAWKCGLVLLAWAAGDYVFQQWNYERGLRMTKQEAKQEMKDVDGNPTTRGRMRRLRRAMLRKIMARDVARATAVITNPTHYAVALEYRPETMAAPIVVAKGRNLLAEKIKQLARWHEVPIIENPPLAQALYKATEVGQAIPPKLYAAVAEILAFLYRAQTRMQAAQRSMGGN
jgi:flagellar biosynthetic protein FlhB